MIEEELDYIKTAMKCAIGFLLDNAFVGFVFFGTQVQVYELGFSDMSKVYVFRGSKEINEEQVLEQLSLRVFGRRMPAPGGGGFSFQNGMPDAGVTRFLLTASECEYTLNSLLDELQTDQWPVAAGNRASRWTGVTLSTVAGLLRACLPGTGAHIIALVGGPRMTCQDRIERFI